MAQTANLYITQLHIRHAILDGMTQTSQRKGLAPAPEVQAERREIIEDMISLLTTMPHGILMANGCSLVSKIRDVGSALLGEGGSSGGGGANLTILLDLLEKLDSPVGAWERVGAAGSV